MGTHRHARRPRDQPERNHPNARERDASNRPAIGAAQQRDGEGELRHAKDDAEEAEGRGVSILAGRGKKVDDAGDDETTGRDPKRDRRARRIACDVGVPLGAVRAHGTPPTELLPDDHRGERERRHTEHDGTRA